MLSHADLSNAYWAKTVATTTYLRNRLVSTALKAGETQDFCISECLAVSCTPISRVKTP